MGITNYKVYTPYEYAEFMCELVLENYFEKEYTKEKLDRIRIADLSCGTGNLLLVIIEKLIKLSQEITGVCYFNSEWVSGYDIDEKAFEEYVAKGRELLERYGVQGEILGYVADSLLDDNSLGKYNVVIGNPPYIGEKNHKELFDKMKETEFGRRYYEGKMDYLYYFIEKGADVLADNGVMVYVTTNYWLKADSAVKLRNKLREEGEYIHIIDYNTSIFKNALGQHNLVFSWRKRERKKITLFLLPMKMKSLA